MDPKTRRALALFMTLIWAPIVVAVICYLIFKK